MDVRTLPTRCVDCLPRRVDRPPRAGDQLRQRREPRLRQAQKWLPRLGAQDPREACRCDRRPVLYSLASNSKPARPATRSGTPRRRRCSSPAGCTTYLRMYWAKKILELEADRPRDEAFDLTLEMNNKYFMCGIAIPMAIPGSPGRDRRQARPPLVSRGRSSAWSGS